MTEAADTQEPQHRPTVSTHSLHIDRSMGPPPPVVRSSPTLPPAPDQRALPAFPDPVKEHGFWSCDWAAESAQPSGNHGLLPVAPGDDQGITPPPRKLTFAFYGDNNALRPALLPPDTPLDRMFFLCMVPPSKHFAVTSTGTQAYLQQPGTGRQQPWTPAHFKSMVQPIARIAKVSDGSSRIERTTVERLAVLDPIQGTGAIATIFIAKDNEALAELMEGYGLRDSSPQRRTINDGYTRTDEPNRAEIIIGVGLKGLKRSYQNLFSQEVCGNIHRSQILQRFPYTCIISPPHGLANAFPAKLMNDKDIRAALFQEGCFIFGESIDTKAVDRNLIHTKSLRYEPLSETDLAHYHKPPGAMRCQLAITPHSVSTHIKLGPADRGFSPLARFISPWYGCVNADGKIIIFPTAHVHTPAEIATGLHTLERHSLVCRVETAGPEIKPNQHCRVCGGRASHRYGTEAFFADPDSCCDAHDFYKYEAAERKYKSDYESYLEEQRLASARREEERKVTETAIRERDTIAAALALEARINADDSDDPDDPMESESHPPSSAAATEESFASAASSAPTTLYQDPHDHSSNSPHGDLAHDGHYFKEVHRSQRYSDSRNQIGISSSYGAMAAHTYSMDIPLLGIVAGPKAAYPRGRGKGKGDNNGRGRGSRGRGLNTQHTYGGKGKGKGVAPPPNWDY